MKPPKHVDDARGRRARDWELTAYVALAAAIAAAIWSSRGNGRHTGDLVFAAYVALLGIGLWLHAVRIRVAARPPRFTRTIAHTLDIALAVAFVLGFLDLVSHGRY